MVVRAGGDDTVLRSGTTIFFEACKETLPLGRRTGARDGCSIRSSSAIACERVKRPSCKPSIIDSLEGFVFGKSTPAAVDSAGMRGCSLAALVANRSSSCCILCCLVSYNNKQESAHAHLSFPHARCPFGVKNIKNQTCSAASARSWRCNATHF